MLNAFRVSSFKARNIDAVFDTDLEYDSHVTAIRQSAYHQLQIIGKVRKYLGKLLGLGCHSGTCYIETGHSFV